MYIFRNNPHNYFATPNYKQLSINKQSGNHK